MLQICTKSALLPNSTKPQIILILNCQKISPKSNDGQIWDYHAILNSISPYFINKQFLKM